MLRFVVLVVVFTFSTGVNGRGGHDAPETSEFLQTPVAPSDPPQQRWGFVDVRPGAHMFYWLMYTSHPAGHTQRPLVMWLQGGPGGSSVGYGNFDIIGPRHINLEPRNTTWLREASLIFVDHPVGAGYSHCDTPDCFTTDLRSSTADLLTLFSHVLRENPDFQSRPFYIFGQSYGGKFSADFARALQEEINAGRVRCDLQGYAMGNAWMSPIDSTITWAPFVTWMSNSDEAGHARIQVRGEQCARAVREGRWSEATDLWRQTQDATLRECNNCDFYNILQYDLDDDLAPSSVEKWYEWLLTGTQKETRSALRDLMNGVARDYLGIPRNVTWGAQSDDVFEKHKGDFMRPELELVEGLLNSTDLQAIVYQGQLDIICDTMGALYWVEKLQWPGASRFQNGTKVPLTDPVTRQTEMFVKAEGKFKFYWVIKAGHAVPKDQGDAALRMLRRVFADQDKETISKQ